jgi:hypothetical protein
MDLLQSFMLQIYFGGGRMTQHHEFEGSPQEWDNLKPEDCIREGEKFLSSGTDFLGDTKVVELGVKLIKIYDSIDSPDDLRQRAFNLECSLSIRQPIILESVIKNAECYIRGQYIDDASPYSPNSFEVLANTGKGNPRVVAFLREVLQDQWGIPRWEAIRSLCKLSKLRDSEATIILADVIRGVYPPKKLSLSDDLLVIERNLEKAFIERLRNYSFSNGLGEIGEA